MDNLTERIANLPPEKRAILLSRLAKSESGASAGRVEQETVTGPVPLLPAQQQLLAMLASYRLNYHHYNLSTMLETAHPLDAELAQQAVEHLVLHHDALRLRLVQDDAGWRQFIAEPGGEIPFSVQDFSMIPEAEQKNALEATAAQLQLSLNITAGPVLRVVYFYLGPQKTHRVLFIVHHMASDTYSMRVLLEDFTTVYQQLSTGRPIQLLPKTTSIKRRAEHMLAYARSAEFSQEFDYWLALPWAEVAPLPPDYPEGLTAPPHPQSVNIAVSAADTQKLIRYSSRLGGIQAGDIILAALARVFSRWNGSRTQLITTHNHGRNPPFEDIDLLRTIGWLAFHVDVMVQIPQGDAPGELVRSVAEQLSRLPGGGIGYELLRGYGSFNQQTIRDSELAAKFQALPRSSIVFNYMGQQRRSRLFRPAQESVGPVTCLPHLWKSEVQMILASIVDSHLHLQWDFSDNVYQRATIEHLADQFIATLRSVIDG